MAYVSAQGEVSMIIRDQPQGCSIESTCFYGMNVVSCEVNTGKFTPLIEAYLPTSNLEHLLDLVEASTPFQYQETIVLGEINANIQAHNPCSQQVAELMM